MTINDFCAACERLTGEGIQIHEASYYGRAFGSWYIDVSQEGGLRRALWDGRDGWLIIQSQRTAGDWEDQWIARDAAAQNVEQVITRLLNRP